METFDAASTSLGDGRFFSGNLNSFSFSSPSTYWKSSLAKLYTTIQISESDFGNNDNLVENHFRMFAFMFPIGTNKACAFGMNPMYRSSLTLVEEQLHFIGADYSPTGDPLAFRTTYDFSGGISEFFTIYSMKVSERFSIGLRWSKLFGNSYYRYVLSLYDVNFNEDETIEYTGEQISFGNFKQRYSSNSYNAEIRFENTQFGLVASYYKTQKLKINLIPEYDLTGWSEEGGNDYYIESGEKHLGIGFKFKINESLGIVSEYNNLKSFNSYDFLNILDDDFPNIISHHLGLYYSVNLENKNQLVDRVNLRLGFYNKKYSMVNSDLEDQGVTLGFGLEYSDYKNTMDFCFKFGSRTSEYATIDYENYFKFIFSISSGEAWFERMEKE